MIMTLWAIVFIVSMILFLAAVGLVYIITEIIKEAKDDEQK